MEYRKQENPRGDSGPKPISFIFPVLIFGNKAKLRKTLFGGRMGFVVFFFLTWLIVSIFTVIQKRLSIVENTMIFLIILIVSINFSWIIIEELQLITLSKKGFEYSAFLLNRSVIIPFIMVILINLLQWSKTIISKCLLIFYSVGLLLCFSNLSSFFDIIEFKKWNYGFEAIYFLVLALIAICANRLFRRFSRNGVNLS